MKKKLLSLVLCIAMVASMVVVPAFAAETVPVKDEVITKWTEREILKGYPDGTFKPEKNITRGEFAAVLDRLMDYQVAAENTFPDVKADAWYAANILNATAAGVLKGDGTNARPDAHITRQEAAVMMARVLKLSGAADKAVTYQDAKLLASWGEDAMLSMAAKGYITATDGALRPTEFITRGEVVAMMDAVFAGYFAEAKTYTEDVTGSALVNLPGVTLKNMKISGDLIVAEGVAKGDFTMDNVQLAGKLIVRGGGENSIHITGKSKVAAVNVDCRNGNVRVETANGAEVTMVYIEDGKDDVIIEGTFGSVNLTGNAPLTLKNAKVETITATGKDAKVTVDKGSKVTTVATKAENTQIIVAGTVANVAATKEATGVSLNVAKGGTATSVTTAAAGSTVTNEGKVGAIAIAKDADTKYVAGEGTKMPKLTAESKKDLTATTVAAEAAAKAAAEAKAAADKAAADKAAAEKLAAAATTDAEKAAAAAAKAAAAKAAAAAEKAAAEAVKNQEAAKKQDDKIKNDADKGVVEKPVTPPSIKDDGAVVVPDPKPIVPDRPPYIPPDPTPTPAQNDVFPVKSVDKDPTKPALDVTTSASTSKDAAGTITIKLSTDKPLRVHENINIKDDKGVYLKGTWVGFAIKAPKGITEGAMCAFGTTPSTEANTPVVLTSDITNVVGGVAGDYYLDPFVNATALTPKTHLTIDWDGAGTTYKPQQYVINLDGVKTEVKTVAATAASTTISEAAKAAGLPADGSVTVVDKGTGALTQAAVNAMGEGGQYVVYHTIPKTEKIAFDHLYYSVNDSKEEKWAVASGGSEPGWFYTTEAADYFKIGGTYATKANGLYTMKDHGVFDHTMRFVKDGNITAELKFTIDFSKYTIDPTPTPDTSIKAATYAELKAALVTAESGTEKNITITQNITGENIMLGVPTGVTVKGATRATTVNFGFMLYGTASVQNLTLNVGEKGNASSNQANNVAAIYGGGDANGTGDSHLIKGVTIDVTSSIAKKALGIETQAQVKTDIQDVVITVKNSSTYNCGIYTSGPVSLTNVTLNVEGTKAVGMGIGSTAAAIANYTFAGTNVFNVAPIAAYGTQVVNGKVFIRLGSGLTDNDGSFGKALAKKLPAGGLVYDGNKSGGARYATSTAEVVQAVTTIDKFSTYQYVKNEKNYKGISVVIVTDENIQTKTKIKEEAGSIVVKLYSGEKLLATSTSKKVTSEIFNNGAGTYTTASTLFTPNVVYPSGSWVITPWTGATKADKPTKAVVELALIDGTTQTTTNAVLTEDYATDGLSAITWDSIFPDTQEKLTAALLTNDVVTTSGDITLTADLTIGAGKTVIVPAGATLTIPAGNTLTNNGTIYGTGTVTQAKDVATEITTKTPLFFGEHYNKENTSGTKVDYAITEQTFANYYIAIGAAPSSSLAEIKMNETTYTNADMDLSVGQNRFLSAPVFQVKEGVLYVCLPALCVEALPGVATVITAGVMKYTVTVYAANSTGTLTVDLAETASLSTGATMQTTATGTNPVTVAAKRITDHHAMMKVVIKDGETVLKGADLCIFRKRADNNVLAITKGEPDAAYGAYATYSEVIDPSAQPIVYNYKLAIPGHGTIDLLLTFTDVASFATTP